MVADHKTLLVIDDDEIVRKSVVAYLEDSGFTIIEAADGRAGLKLFTEKKPDLVICDLRMPIVDGMSVLKSISQDSAAIPVIVISGAGVMNDVVEALRLGASDYFIKPVTDLELLELAVRRCLEQSQLRQENRRYRLELEQANLDLMDNLSVLQQDQQAGRYIQLKMLPETPKMIGTYEFNHHIIPSLFLSGDFVEYVTVGEEHVTFFIADVSGHGASSAFVTVLLKNLTARLRSAYTHTNDRSILSPAQILQKTNAEMLELELGKHVTMFVGVLNLIENSLRYSIAGHLPAPILASSEGACYLMGKGFPVGLFENVKFEEHQIQLPDEFVLTLLSDGILEILPEKSLADKESQLLETFNNGGKPLDSTKLLGIQDVKDAPDDIAVMNIVRNKNAEG